MRHIGDGTLRRMVDEPLAVSGRDREHYETCSRCRSRFEEVSSDARSAAALFSAPQVRVEPLPALTQLRLRVGAQGVERASWWRQGLWRLENRRFTGPLGGLAAAAALAGVVAWTPAGSLAQSFIQIFQPQQVAPISLTTADLQSLPDLRMFGAIHGMKRLADQPQPSAAAATAASGMSVAIPGSLPSGVSASSATYDVMPGRTVSFTFSAARARRTAATLGKRMPAMPAGMDGSTLRVTTGAAVAAVYGGGQGSALPSLVIGEMKAPTISSTGVTVQEMENYVLSLPGVTPGLANAIRSIGDPTKTLPIPIPVGAAQSHTVSVQGVQGVAVGDSTGLGSGVVWEKDGVIYGVAGTQTEDAILATANSLH